MYIPRTFRMSESDAVQFMADHPFAVLFSTTRDGEPLATHLPLVRREDGTLMGHMARANPHARHLDGARVLAVFAGPHAYIDPEWYGPMPNVPTWNYLAVHVTGTCHVMPAVADAAAVLRELARFMNAGSPIPAALGDADHPDHAYYEDQVPAIVSFAIQVERVEGKAKLGQNRSREDREGAAAGLISVGDPDSVAIAQHMLATVGEEAGDS